MDIGLSFSAIKWVHMSCAGLSVSLFASRAAWIVGTRRPLWRWLKIVPHAVDTLLLASGLTMAFLIHQYPLYNSDWLTAKVMGLALYIGLGIMVFRGPRQRTSRAIFTLCALLVFAYIVSVAVTHNPAGFFDHVIARRSIFRRSYWRCNDIGITPMRPSLGLCCGRLRFGARQRCQSF